MCVGLGSGSTAEVMTHLLGERVRDEGLALSGAVATSVATREIAASYGLPLKTLDEVEGLDVVIDGADEVDPNLDLLKGGGGAHLHEKIVASAARRMVVIVDGSKLVERLGAFRLPLEVIEAARRPVTRAVAELGGEVELRVRDGAPFRTQEGNLILDGDFGLIEEPAALARALSEIPGLVEHGLFVDMADVVLVGRGGDVETLRRG